MIQNEGDCKFAGRALGREEFYTLGFGDDRSPGGCYESTGMNTMYRVSYNSKLDSAVSCGRSIFYCFCWLGQECAYRDGKQANPESRMCGTNICDPVTEGLYCESTTSTCAAAPACIHSRGNLSNDNVAACSCGSAMCNSTTGLFCLASESKCSKEKVGFAMLGKKCSWCSAYHALQF